jgi:hypothetical protein
VTRAIALAGLLALSSCASHAGMLVAETGEHRLTARDTDSGVTVVMTSGAWDGVPDDLESELAVLHILVVNEGQQPILLAPGDFEFRDRRGFTYAVLDAGASFRLATEAERSSRKYDFDLTGGYDPGGPGKVELIQPQGDIARLALPWGVLLPGTQMRGYLYLEPVAPTANGGALTWHMKTPAHQPIADIEFPLAVTR